MIELSEAQSDIITAIINGKAHGVKDSHGRIPRHAHSPVKALIAAGAAEDDIKALEREGWLEAWPRADGRMLTLTPEAAIRRGVELAEHFEVSRRDDPDPEKVRKTRSGDVMIGRNGKPIPRRITEVTEEPDWRNTTPPNTKLSPRGRACRMGDYDLVELEPESREPSPLDQAIAREEEEVAMQDTKREDGRTAYDPATGKAKREPIVLMPRYRMTDKSGGLITIDKRLGSKNRRRRQSIARA